MKEEMNKKSNVEIEITGEEFQKLETNQNCISKQIGEEKIQVVVGTPAFFNNLTNERLNLILEGIKHEIEQNKLSNAELGLAYKITKYVENLLVRK